MRASFSGLWCYLLISLVLLYYAGTAAPLAMTTGMSLTEYILYVLTDHYYLIYAWFFFLLFWIMQTLQKGRQQEWIRYGSYRKKYNRDNLAAGLQLSLMIAGNFLLVFFVGFLRIGLSGGFRAAGQFGGTTDQMQVLAGYAKIFPSPVIALLCVLLYWNLGSFFLYIVLYYGHCLGGRKVMAAGIVLCIVSTIVGFMTDMDKSWLNVIFFNNDYILHHVLLLMGPMAACRNVIIMMIGWIGIRGVALWKKGIPT